MYVLTWLRKHQPQVGDCGVVAEGGGRHGAVLGPRRAFRGRSSGFLLLQDWPHRWQRPGESAASPNWGGGLVLLLSHVLLPGLDPHGHPLLVAGGPVALDGETTSARQSVDCLAGDPLIFITLF